MADDRERDGDGRFTPERDTEDLLGAMTPREPYTTGELAEVLGWPRRTVYNHLSTLEEDGELRKKKPEPRRAIWIRPEGGDA